MHQAIRLVHFASVRISALGEAASAHLSASVSRANAWAEFLRDGKVCNFVEFKGGRSLPSLGYSPEDLMKT